MKDDETIVFMVTEEEAKALGITKNPEILTDEEESELFGEKEVENDGNAGQSNGRTKEISE